MSARHVTPDEPVIQPRSPGLATPLRCPTVALMLDYNTEAAVYDATRGGMPRAEAAARALLGLVPESARTLLDIGCGTGLVAERMALARPALRVLGTDASFGMARFARQRIGAVALADARRLPLPTVWSCRGRRPKSWRPRCWRCPSPTGRAASRSTGCWRSGGGAEARRSRGAPVARRRGEGEPGLAAHRSG
jgi:SAM-dependent methyltransferase